MICAANLEKRAAVFVSNNTFATIAVESVEVQVHTHVKFVEVRSWC